MPIYAYRCSSCGHQQDVLQKLSAAKLTVCPSCGQSTFTKQLSAPAFQLKGTGWYVTDFRDNKKPGGEKSLDKDGDGRDKAAAEPGGAEKGGGEKIAETGAGKGADKGTDKGTGKTAEKSGNGAGAGGSATGSSSQSSSSGSSSGKSVPAPSGPAPSGSTPSRGRGKSDTAG